MVSAATLRLLRLRHVLANTLFQLSQTLVVAHFLGEVVIQLRHGPLLDCLHRHFVGSFLAGEFRLGIVGRIDDLGLQLLPGLGAAEHLGKRLDRIFAAHFDQRVLAFDGGSISLVFDFSRIGDLRPIAVHKRAVLFDRLDGGARLAQLGQLMLKLFVGDRSRRLLDNNILVAVDRKRRQILECRLHMKRLAVFNRELRNLRLAHRDHTQIAHALIEALRQKLIDHFLANLAGESLPDNRFRNLARPEPRNARVLLIVARHRAECLGDVFGGNIEHQLARAIRIQHRPMRVFMPMFVRVVVAFVIVGVVRLWCFVAGRIFEGISRTQRVCLPGAARQRNCLRRSGEWSTAWLGVFLSLMVEGSRVGVKPATAGLAAAFMRRSRYSSETWGLRT